MTTRLLIDADLMAYRAAVGTQTNFDWGDTGKSVTTDMAAAQRQLRDQIDKWMAELEADAFTICLSDDFRSFRKEDVDPSYKAVRADVERPELLYQLKDWLYGRFPSERHNRLEADDVMGIRSTEPGTGETRIIVSQDKDMKTIPGFLYRPFEDKPDIQEITLAEADHFHLLQTLAGDAVDGYPGCYGIGIGRAETALRTLTGYKLVDTVRRTGPLKGTVKTTWEKTPMDDPWAVVVSHFERIGQTWHDAIRQARLARILRWEDQRNFRPILWNPA